MITAVSECCSPHVQVSFAEKARNACINTNWNTVDYKEINVLVSIIRGDHKVINGFDFLNSLFADIEIGNVSKNVAFILKTLIVFDFLVEAKLFLDIIKKYQNEQLIFFTGFDQNMQSYSMLIAGYHLYIKQKAKLQQLQRIQMVLRQTRQQFMESATEMEILNQINIALKIQSLILQISEKYKNGEKNHKIIKFIFSLLLRTYLSCHSIVTIAIKIFTNRIFTFSLFDLNQYIRKFFNYYKGEYSENLKQFINSNKQIECYKNIAVDQILLDHQVSKIEKLLSYQISNIESDPGMCPEPETIISKAEIQIKMDLNEFNKHYQSNTTAEQDNRMNKKIKQSNKFNRID